MVVMAFDKSFVAFGCDDLLSPKHVKFFLFAQAPVFYCFWHSLHGGFKEKEENSAICGKKDPELLQSSDIDITIIAFFPDVQNFHSQRTRAAKRANIVWVCTARFYCHYYLMAFWGWVEGIRYCKLVLFCLKSLSFLLEKNSYRIIHFLKCHFVICRKQPKTVLGFSLSVAQIPRMGETPQD